MKTKIEFGFGQEYADSGETLGLEQRRVGQNAIRARAVELFGGCTLVGTLGDWYDPDTDLVVSEAGCTLSVLSDIPPVLLTERVNDLVACIKASLLQKAVALTLYPVDSDIV